MKKRTSRKSFLAMLLALAMMLTMLPAAAFAAEEKAAFGVKEVTTLESGKSYVIVTKDKAGNYVAMSNEETDGTDIGYSPARVRIGVAIDVEATLEGSAITKLTFDASKKANMYFTSTSGSGGVYFENPSRSTGASNYRVYITDTGDKGAIKYQNSRIVNYSSKQLYGINESGNTNYYVTLAATADEYGIRFITTKTQSEAAEIIILEVTDENADPEPEDPLAAEKQSAKDGIDSAVADAINTYGYYEAGLKALKSLADDYKGKIDAADSSSKISGFVQEFTNTASKILTKTDIDKQKAELDKISSSPEFSTYSKDEQKKILDLIDQYKANIEAATSEAEMKELVKEFQTGLDDVTKGSQATADAKTKASGEIDKAVADSNLAKYKAAEQGKIKELAAKYKDAISKAASATEIDKLLKEFNAEVAKLKTAAQIDSETNAALKEQVTKATVSIKKPKVGKKKVTAKWKANKLFDGYQVSYRIKGKKWKKVTVKGGTKTKKVIKKLKKGKKYQVKVRGYKTIAGAKVYSKFSKTKTTKKVK